MANLKQIGTFKEIAKEFSENLEAIECTYEIDMNNIIESVALKSDDGFLKMFFYKNDNNEIEIYAESENTGKTCKIIAHDEIDTKLIVANNVGYKFNNELNQINKEFVPEQVETITQSIARIEQNIYKVEYDKLSEYLKGIRDFMNLLNGTEDNKSITDYILAELNEYNNDSEIPF